MFKDYIQHKPNSTSVSSLITYGTLMKKSVILELGNFNPFLKHSEDEDMAFRINKSKYYSLGNSDLEIICVIKNSLFEVYERYWRWNIGRHEKFSAKTYFNNVKCSIKPMAQIDISNNDYFSAVLSLIYPHYFILKSISNYFSVNKNIID